MAAPMPTGTAKKMTMTMTHSVPSSAVRMPANSGTLAWVRRHYVLIMRIGGGLLVAIGILLVTGIWDSITIWMRTLVPGFETPL